MRVQENSYRDYLVLPRLTPGLSLPNLLSHISIYGIMISDRPTTFKITYENPLHSLALDGLH